MSSSPTVLVLGATGFTGQLIAKYLASHRQKDAFTLALAGRSRKKLTAIADELALDSQTAIVEVDVSDEQQIEAAVQRASVVITVVGPYMRYGTPVIKACARHGVHYVDLNGETTWMHQIMHEVDWTASKSGAIIVPSGGFESLPGDLGTYLSIKTLQNHYKSINEPWKGAGESLTSYSIRGGFSGGTLATVIQGMEISASAHKAAYSDFALSPVKGHPSPPPKLLYSIPEKTKSRVGGLFIGGMINRAIVQRSWGLIALQNMGLIRDETAPSDILPYGDNFTYQETLVQSSRLSALITGLGLLWVFLTLKFIPPLRTLAQKILPPGSGPSEDVMRKGFMRVVNTTVAEGATPARARTAISGKGDPGYSLTAVMISEVALGLVLTPRAELSALARRGGLLTPATALGDILASRFEASGRLEVSSEIL